MKTMILHGFLTEKFGKSYTMDVESPAEFLRAIASQVPGFKKTIHEGVWHFVRGDLETATESCSDTAEDLLLGMGDGEVIHLMPAIEGSGSGGGVFSFVLGAVLTVVGIWTYNPSLTAAGVGLMLGGVVMMTTKIPGIDNTNTEGPDTRASFLFTGPRNQSTQGVAIPRGYGRAIVGSTVISVGLYAERLP